MSTPRRVTQAEVAQKAGVSRTVASFVLNGRTDQRIAPATAQRVLRAAQELGYRPNKIADILRTGQSGTIALISDLITTTAAAGAMVRGALDGARAHGMLLFTAETLTDPELEKRVITSLLDRQIDGIIYASMFSREVEVPDYLADHKVVLLNCIDPDLELPAILPDDEAAGRQAAELLVDAGCTQRVVFLGVLPDGAVATLPWSNTRPLALQRRLRGISSVLDAHGISFECPPLTEPLWEAPTGRASTQALLRTDLLPSAIICANDALAFGAYQALSEAGLTIPDDVAIVSFDGTELGRWLIPQLTTLALPHEEMGRLAVETLLADRPPHAGEHLVSMPIVSGQSITEYRQASH